MALAPFSDISTSTALVRVLLAAQAPALADLPVAWQAAGWDHDTYRLGEGLVVRLPRRAQAVAGHENEVQWLPILGPTLTARTPQPIFVGKPSSHFPRPWSVVEHIPGSIATSVPVSGRASLAEDLADLLWSLHAPAPSHAPINPARGGSLATEAVDARARERLTHLARTGDAALAGELLPRWDAWLGAPDFDGVDAWVHGDLHPHNLVVGDDGRLAGVLDWGDLTAGDPACDLATAWLTFDEAGRRAFRERVDQGGTVDPHTWTRAKAWALHLGLILRTATDDQPALTAVGEHALTQLGTEQA